MINGKTRQAPFPMQSQRPAAAASCTSTFCASASFHLAANLCLQPSPRDDEPQGRRWSAGRGQRRVQYPLRGEYAAARNLRSNGYPGGGSSAGAICGDIPKFDWFFHR